MENINVKKQLNKIFLGIILVISSLNLIAQENSHVSKLPWVKGVYPNHKKGYVRINSISSDLNTAFKKVEEKLVSSIIKRKGVHVENTEVLNSSSDRKLFVDNKQNKNLKSSVHSRYTKTIKMKGQADVTFSEIDHYYEYKNGTYHLWVLYLVSENNEEIKNIPTLAYKVDNGAWRSLLVPGWAQFYTKQPVKGTLFLAGEAGLLVGGFYLLNRATYNDTRAKEANSIKIKQEYRKRAKSYRTYSYIAFGAAAGYYIYNVVDAFTSKKGKMVYDYKNIKFAFTPTVNLTEHNHFVAGVNIQF